MRDNKFFKKLILLLSLAIISLNSLGQDKLLSMKIIYSVPIMKAEIKSSAEKDSIQYTYIVDKRFWWQTFDKIISKSQTPYDTLVNRFSKTLKEKFNREFSVAETKNLIDNGVRKIEFEERWVYDTKTMLIKSEVCAFQPIITIDTIVLEGEELAVKEIFSYPLGWFKPGEASKKSEKVIIASNKDLRESKKTSTSSPTLASSSFKTLTFLNLLISHIPQEAQFSPQADVLCILTSAFFP